MKKAAFYLFVTSLIFSPLAFGTVENWSYLTMTAIICAGALLMTVSSRGSSFYKAPGIIPLLLSILFLFFQIIPLPANLVKFLSPSTYDLYQGVFSLTGQMDWISLSIYPRSTLMELLRFSCYVLFYTVSLQFFSDQLLLKRTVAIVIGFASVLSLIAIIEFVTESLNYPFPHHKIFWMKELTHGGTPVGPYVNRNHYAGLMEMIFPLALAMFLAYRPVMTKISFKRKVSDFFNHRRVNQHFLFGTAAVLIATSILLSLSRGGILSLSLSMLIFSILLILKVKQHKAGLFIGFIVIIVLFLTGTSGWDAIFQRFEAIRNQSGLLYDDRLILWKDSIRIIRDFPWVGAGGGAFEKIYPLYRTFPGNDLVEHAHNDYLEFLCAGGIVLPLLMGWGLFSILYSACRTFLKRREWYCLLLFTGCITSISAVLLHSLLDFNMQIGANGLYFFLVLALAVSAANTRMRPGMASTHLAKSKAPPVAVGIAALLLLLAAIHTYGGALIADACLYDHRNTALTSDLSAAEIAETRQAAETAAAWDILNPRYSHIRAQAASLLGKDSDALKYYARSLRQDPKNSRYLMNAGSFAYGRNKPDLAETLFGLSIQYDRTNMAAYLKYADMLFGLNQAEKGFRILKQAISADIRITDASLALMVYYHIDEDEMRRALPDRVEPYLTLGDFFDASGAKEKAEQFYVLALEQLANEAKIEKNHFYHVFLFYQRHHMDENALQVILRAIRYFPDDHGLHRTAGDLYKDLGIDYRAEEEYRKAEILKSQ
ncbi:MAG: O-antigen ligase family protein [Desulfobacterales bacterium]|jgi:O-antigen ligase/Tfp pilus assembly protein PilF|nr:O-antigen ligase family protein [Desulfobacterales bacterium]